MNDPKTEEIVKSLRDCSADEMDCKNCVAEWGRKYGYCFNMLRLYAADRLEKLETELSKLKAQQRWIPVEERLPEFAEDVLAVDTIGVVEKGMYIGDDTWLLEGGTLTTPYVRWWKTFPESPKEEQHESERVPQGN